MKITVIGAGFSGLTAARELQRRGFEVTVVERSAQAGGMLVTEQNSMGLIEKAAPSMNRTDRVDRFFSELNLVPLVPDEASKKRLFFRKTVRKWPLGILESINLFFHFVTSKIFGTVNPRSKETVAQWGKRVLGRAGTRQLFGAGLQGIYAGDIDSMSATLVVSPMFDPKREKFRGVLSSKGGMGEMVQALENDLRAKGVQFQFNQTVDPKNLPKPCVIATSLTAAANLISHVDHDLSKRLATVRTASLVSVTVFFDEPTGPKAFGCLVPRGQKVRTLGILLNHAIFPGRDKKFSETWIMGGATDTEVIHWSDEQIYELILKERKQIFRKENLPLAMHINRWEEALPHYDLVLEEVLKNLREPTDVLFHGNWLGGIGLSRILERSERLAERAMKEWNK